MRLLKIFSLLIILLLTLGSCESLLNPEDDSHSNADRILKDPGFAEGLLMTAYVRLPTLTFSYTDVATDDAVTNNKLDQFHRMAVGEWSAIYNPMNLWDNCNMSILYLNNFLSVVDNVSWKWSNAELNNLYIRRFKGEAYALRGLFEYYLLQRTGGFGANGEKLGIPIYNKFITVNDNLNVPRATFDESVAQIYADFNKALEYFTMDDYVDVTTTAQLPAGLTTVSIVNYNAVFGLRASQRISGRIVKAYKARVALLVASPAFNTGNDLTLWANAANYAGDVLSKNLAGAGIAGLDPVGHRFFDATRIDAVNLASNLDSKETIWRSTKSLANSRELANYPPSLFGNGNVNPTQNLVDAFPMKNGYPITNPLSLYDPASPYANRDLRLALYIVYNGNTLNGLVIKTGVGGGSNAKDSIQTSTRTGYYMKKLLREDVNVSTTAASTKNHYEVHMRYTDLFLMYAEAANEAWGPDGTGGTYTFTARDVIRAIRNRAGITQPDNYLNSIVSKDDMRTVIRNERRLELCFEGFRFWDLLRWNADLTATAKGININRTSTTFTVVDVEPRVYDNSFMHYGPLPQLETVKFNALIQNKGW
jgi:starch-binding outer membrane protein, SusD/RagB family